MRAIPFTILACLPWSFAYYVVWDVVRPSCTARFLCVIFAEICVNATPDWTKRYQWYQDFYETFTSDTGTRTVPGTLPAPVSPTSLLFGGWCNLHSGEQVDEKITSSPPSKQFWSGGSENGWAVPKQSLLSLQQPPHRHACTNPPTHWLTHPTTHTRSLMHWSSLARMHSPTYSLTCSRMYPHTQVHTHSLVPSPIHLHVW